MVDGGIDVSRRSVLRAAGGAVGAAALSGIASATDPDEFNIGLASNEQGAGLVDAEAAVDSLSSDPPPTPTSRRSTSRSRTTPTARARTRRRSASAATPPRDDPAGRCRRRRLRKQLHDRRDGHRLQRQRGLRIHLGERDREH